jgi:GDP-4-dehydro-6-deoxy-D-mannose reductase
VAFPNRILVTGGRGFVGSHLLPTLNHAFAGIELLAPPAGVLDVTDAAATDAYVSQHRPDVCIHLAGVTAIPAARRDPHLAWNVNLHGTLGLAQALLRRAPDCFLLYPSSADAYGRSFRSGNAIDESVPLSPMNAYGATKAAAEMALLALAADGLRVIILRPFNHTGAGQSAAFAVAAFARQVARVEARLQPPVVRVGALAPKRDFLDVRDVCAAYVATIRHADTLAAGSIFNIASGVPRRMGDVLTALMTLAAVDAQVETANTLLRPGEIASAAGNAGAARQALGWSPVIDWETTLRDVLDDWRSRVHSEPQADAGPGSPP